MSWSQNWIGEVEKVACEIENTKMQYCDNEFQEVKPILVAAVRANLPTGVGRLIRVDASGSWTTATAQVVDKQFNLEIKTVYAKVVR